MLALKRNWTSDKCTAFTAVEIQKDSRKSRLTTARWYFSRLFVFNIFQEFAAHRNRKTPKNLNCKASFVFANSILIGYLIFCAKLASKRSALEDFAALEDPQKHVHETRLTKSFTN